MSRSEIKIKAMALFVADGRMLVTPGFDSVKQTPYYRLLGGHVEFGESAAETLKREMLEELETEIEVLERLEVVENCFVYEGAACHEIVFIYHARFLDDALTRRDELPNVEPNTDEISKWLPISDVLHGPVPLYPPADYPGFLSAIGVDMPG